MATLTTMNSTLSQVANRLADVRVTLEQLMMETMENDQIEIAEPSELAEKPLTLWQWLVHRVTKSQPMVCDLKAEMLYEAQVKLLRAQNARDDALYALTREDALIEALTLRVVRLSGGALPNPRTAMPTSWKDC